MKSNTWAEIVALRTAASSAAEPSSAFRNSPTSEQRHRAKRHGEQSEPRRDGGRMDLVAKLHANGWDAGAVHDRDEDVAGLRRQRVDGGSRAGYDASVW